MIIAISFTGGLVLSLFYFLIRGCMVDIEAAKSVNNLEFNTIVLSQLNENSVISIDAIAQLSETPHITATYLNPTSEEDIASLLDDKMTINGLTIGSMQLRLYTHYQGFEAFDPILTAKTQNIFKDFTPMVYGSMLSDSSEFELLLDDVSAYRFSQNYSLDRSTAIRSMLGKTIVMYVNGTDIVATIKGIYDYRCFIERSAAESTEAQDIFDGFIHYEFNSEDIANSQEIINGSDICCPIIINEAMANAMKQLSGNTETEGVFSGIVTFIVDDINNVANTMAKMDEKTDCTLTNSLKRAEVAIKRFSAFNNIIAMVAIAVVLLNVVCFINLCIFVVDEKQRFAGVLTALGYPRNSISGIITTELILTVAFGWFLSVLLLFASRSFLSAYLQSVLEGEELIRVISIPIPWVEIGVSLLIVMVLAGLAGYLTSRRVLRKKSAIALMRG